MVLDETQSAWFTRSENTGVWIALSSLLSSNPKMNSSLKILLSSVGFNLIYPFDMFG